MTDYSKQAPYDPSDWQEAQRRRAAQAEHQEARRTSNGFGYRSATDLGIRPDPPKPAEIMPAPAQPVDLSLAWQPTTSPSRDSVSAVDRAKAVHIRAVPVYVAVLGVALVAVILYAMTLWFFRVETGAPWALDRILVFVGTLTGVGLFVYLRLNAQEYDHSHAGVERLRIDRAAEIQIAIVEAETEIKLRALDAYLKLIGVRDE